MSYNTRNQEESSFLRVVLQVTRGPETAGNSLRLKNGTTLYFDGIYSKLIYDIKDALNLNFQVIPEPGRFGSTINYILNGSADLVAYQFKEELDYDEGLGSSFIFLHAIISESKGLFFRQPLHKDYDSILLLPFTFNLWMAILIVFLILSILSFSIAALTSKQFRDTYFSISEILIHPVYLILGKIWPNIQNFKIYKVVYIIPSLFLATLLINVYSAKVISNLANNDGRLIRNRGDLLRFGYTFYGFRNANQLERLYPESLHVQLRKQPYIEVMPQNYRQMMQRVIAPKPEDGRYVLFNQINEFYASTLSFATRLIEDNRESCWISSFPSRIKYPRAMIIKKDLPLKGEINFILLRLNERGFRFRYHTEYERRIQPRCVNNGPSLVQITNEHVSLAYQLLLGGGLISIITEAIIYLIKLAIKSRK